MPQALETLSYDIFIIHAGPDRVVAEQLYSLLSPHCSVFLDSKSLQPGDLWADELESALEASALLAILVSPNIDPAYYAKEEIARAISLFRQRRRRLVPIYIGGEPGRDIKEPYGLKSLRRASTILRQPAWEFSDLSPLTLVALAD